MKFKKITITTILVATIPVYADASDGITATIGDGEAGNQYIDKNGSLIIKESTSNNNLTILNALGDANGLRSVYGGHCGLENFNCSATNNTVTINNTGNRVGTVVGAYSNGHATVTSNYTTSYSANVIINNASTLGNVSGTNVYRAFDNNSTGTLNLNSNGSLTINKGSYSSASSATGAVLQLQSGVYDTGLSTAGVINSTTNGNVTLNDVLSYKTTGASINNYGFINTKINATNTTVFNNTVTGNVYINGGNNRNVSGVEFIKNISNYEADYKLVDTEYNLNAVGNIYLNDIILAGSYVGVNIQQNSPYGKGLMVANGNVTISGNSSTDANGETKVFGSYFNQYGTTYSNYQLFNNNTLTISSQPLSLNTVGNFEFYKFNINDNNSRVVNTGDSILTISDELVNNSTTDGQANYSAAAVSGISGSYNAVAGDRINLIKYDGNTTTLGSNAESLSTYFNKTTDSTVDVGLARKANIKYVITNNTVTAVIDSIDDNTAEENDVKVKPLSEGRLASLMNASRVNDLVLSSLDKAKPVGTFTPIAMIDGGLNKYNTSSNVKAHDYRFLVGSRYQFTDELYAGLAFSYSHSNYDLTGIDGKSHNYGINAFARYEANNFYSNFALGFGKDSNDFDSSIITGSGKAASYDSRVNYISGLVGAGYITKINERFSLDSSMHYLYSKLGSDSAVIDGDSVNFDSLTSSRMQLKEQLNIKATDSLDIFLAGTYSYEFDGKAGSSVIGRKVNTLSAQGSTAGMELGFKHQTTDVLSYDVKFTGYAGKRDGVSVSAFIQYDF